VHHRSSNSSVARHCDDQVRSKVHSKVSFEKIRRRAPINEYGSARLHLGHLWAQRNRVDLEEVQPDFISRSRLKVVEDRPMKRAANEKECRGLVVNRLRHNSNSSHSSGSKVPRLPQPITARDMASRKAETRGNQKERHRHGRNNFSVTNTSGSGM